VARKRAPLKSDGVWAIHRGEPRPKSRTKARLRDVEPLTFNNPYGYGIERVWFDGKVIYASEQGEVDIDEAKVKVAQEYQIVYSVKLTPKRHLATAKRVPGQFNIYDSVPGMRKYSPIWQFNYVIVPKDYIPNSLRSERDCLRSGYEIRRSMVFEN